MMKIAIIGTGISGNIAAWLLNRQHDITVYEKNGYVGGHARTLNINHSGKSIDVDTGFIVFNHRCYPLLKGLFDHLGIATDKSDMSFGVSIRGGWLEYGTHNLSSLFGQRRNLLRPSYWRMLFDILSFFKAAKKLLAVNDASITLGQFIVKHRFGTWFRDHYLLPMGGAIWSCPVQQMLEFPALTFMRFFDNHGLLSPDGQLQWYTVRGGSKAYIERLTADFKDRIRLNSPVSKITARDGKVEVVDGEGRSEIFDQVIIAAHADEALAMLHEPTAAQQNILHAFPYQENVAYLHRDASFMPKRKACWSSWVYLSREKNGVASDMSLTYWMNNLQNLDPSHQLFVTLNPEQKPAPEAVFDVHTFHHPVFTQAAIAAQTKLEQIQGQNGIWFCGAYTRYGFHEDGMLSGVKVAQALGAEVPWQRF